MSDNDVPTILPKNIAVCFDTSSVISKDSPYRLFHARAVALFRNPRSSDHVHVDWYVSRIVIEERRYRMRERARKLCTDLPAIDALLGRAEGLDAEALLVGVDRVIEEQLSDLNVGTLEVPDDSGLLEEIAMRAVQRMSPFGDNDKGFRDAVIAESFLSHCRAAAEDAEEYEFEQYFWFVTADGPLAAYVNEKLPDVAGLRVFASCDEVESQLNATAAHLPDDVLERLTESAAVLFHAARKKSSFLYASGAYAEIERICESELGDPGAEPPIGPRIEVRRPLFARMDGELITWDSTVICEFAYDRVLPPSLARRMSLSPDLAESPTGFGKVRVWFHVRWTVARDKDDALDSPTIVGVWHPRTEAEFVGDGGQRVHKTFYPE